MLPSKRIQKNAGKKAKRKKEHMNKYKANSKIVDNSSFII